MTCDTGTCQALHIRSPNSRFSLHIIDHNQMVPALYQNPKTQHKIRQEHHITFVSNLSRTAIIVCRAASFTGDGFLISNHSRCNIFRTSMIRLNNWRNRCELQVVIRKEKHRYLVCSSSRETTSSVRRFSMERVDAVRSSISCRAWHKMPANCESWRYDKQISVRKARNIITQYWKRYGENFKNSSSLLRIRRLPNIWACDTMKNDTWAWETLGCDLITTKVTLTQTPTQNLSSHQLNQTLSLTFTLTLTRFPSAACATVTC